MIIIICTIPRNWLEFETFLAGRIFQSMEIDRTEVEGKRNFKKQFPFDGMDRKKKIGEN